MLRTRIITASILAPLVIASLFFLPVFAFGVLLALIMALAAWEWSALCGWQRQSVRAIYAALVFFLAIFSGAWIKFIPWPFLIKLIALGWLLALVYLIVIERNRKIFALPSSLTAVAGILVLVTAWASIEFLQAFNPLQLLTLLLVVWVADIAAYFGGRRWGKKKLAPHISPNKTWAGFYTAIITVLLLVTIGLLFLQPPLRLWGWLGVILLTVIAAVVGDLFESLLKRQSGLKDSGHLLPGHGGLLDRIDSLLAAAPVFVCGIMWMATLK
jgi:phosphatidate cytidylyltransferase